MLCLIKRSIRPLPTELDKYKGIIQRIWDGPQVNTSEHRSSPGGWVWETAYWLSLTGFISFTASQFYFSGKTFQCPWAATKRGALSPFFNMEGSLGETWLSTELKRSSLWNTNTQPDMTHFNVQQYHPSYFPFCQAQMQLEIFCYTCRSRKYMRLHMQACTPAPVNWPAVDQVLPLRAESSSGWF